MRPSIALLLASLLIGGCTAPRFRGDGIAEYPPHGPKKAIVRLGPVVTGASRSFCLRYSSRRWLGLEVTIDPADAEAALGVIVHVAARDDRGGLLWALDRPLTEGQVQEFELVFRNREGIYFQPGHWYTLDVAVEAANGADFEVFLRLWDGRYLFWQL